MVKTQWFARGGDIDKMGPFKTQEDASAHLMRADGKGPIDGAFVWLEKVR
jgi:hypothetical protein